MPAIFGLGQMELLIVLIMLGGGFCLLVVPLVAVVVVILATRASSQATRPVPCPHCGVEMPPHVQLCGNCGKPLK